MEINHSRRNFFRDAHKSVAHALVGEVDRRADNYRRHYVRPPYAINELEFLLKCTRCQACIDACQPGALFELSDRLGLGVVHTPALDLMNNACRLCPDFPCVNACVTGALFQGEKSNNEIPLPRLAYVEVDLSLCLAHSGPECGACGGVCPPGSNAMLFDDQNQPRVDRDLCLGCGLCRLHCVVSPKAIRIVTLGSESN